ncbi:methyltransferase-like protein 25 [Teleopsis dalmanni]|uniref:methyltransferase-like protein 25 n=1 Tax=Teleopsis dalmanni TaxID=139649 RepID=UPI0018CD7967|nr:methyltransferase-like protein 25 [Teleopsis dalmanni]
MSITNIKKRLNAILNFMHPYWEFVNCHMVNYITDKHWNQHIPTDIRAEISDEQNVQDCIKNIFIHKNKKELKLDEFKAINQFFSHALEYDLSNCEDIITTVEDLYKSLGKEHVNEKLSIKEFMSEKKSHEVELTAELVNDLMEIHPNEKHNLMFIVDAGDGKGYLSSRLALQYKHKVLGIDFNEQNTESALRRSNKLQRAWNSLTVRAELKNKGITPPRRGNKPKDKIVSTNINENVINYQTISKFITTDLKITHLIKELFSIPTMVSPNFCLTGLHTCGNLAPTCLKVFHAQQECKIICNIGCCYHMLKESFSGPEFFGNKVFMDKQTTEGFPMSNFLRNKKVKLGRNARMLAVQSMDRTLAANELPNISLFYRALLEVLICEMNPDLRNTVQVGRIKKYRNFKEYLKLCSNKVNINFESISTERITKIESDYAIHKNYLDLFYLLRMAFAPVLESIILLDRLLYLKELGYERSYLVPIFDSLISPRCFAVIALK